jgi:hypothetical protein
MGNTPKKVAAIRAGRLVNATTPAKTEAAKQSISLGQMALNNADDKNTYGKRTYPDNVAINRNPDMGGAKSSKERKFTPRSKPIPPSRSKTKKDFGVDTDSYSGASRPNPGFEFNDNVAPKPLNTNQSGTKNTNFRYADNADGTKNVGAPIVDNFIKTLFGVGPSTSKSSSNAFFKPKVQIGTKKKNK